MIPRIAGKEEGEDVETEFAAHQGVDALWGPDLKLLSIPLDFSSLSVVTVKA
jgi:hypothetical protein